jgi:formate hydrogenlyase subunit 3/multisubunit Na+/H+ antiporter MnhD subunit
MVSGLWCCRSRPVAVTRGFDDQYLAEHSLPVADSYPGFFAMPADGKHYTEIKEAPKTILLAMIITSIASIVMFFYPDPFYRLATLAAEGS